MKYRNPYVVSMRNKKAGVIKDRRAPRQGSYNEQQDLMYEYLQEQEIITDGYYNKENNNEQNNK